MVELPTLYQSFIHGSRYSRWLPEEGRREIWEETVERYFKFFEDHLLENHKYKLNKELRDELKNAVLNLEVMPSMRALMTAGEALKRENVAGYNCSYVAVNRLRAFDEILYVLMNGCFDKDTMIKTASGPKKISDITPNDQVLSYDIEKDKFEFINPEWCVETLHSAEKKKIEIEFEDGSLIKCTEDHEFYTTNRGWVKAKDLTEEDDIKNYHES
jgi:intein/homing endonuclease